MQGGLRYLYTPGNANIVNYGPDIIQVAATCPPCSDGPASPTYYVRLTQYTGTSTCSKISESLTTREYMLPGVCYSTAQSSIISQYTSRDAQTFTLAGCTDTDNTITISSFVDSACTQVPQVTSTVSISIGSCILATNTQFDCYRNY